MKICSKISSMTEGDADRHQMVLGDDGQILGQLGDASVAKKAELELNDKMETMVAEKGVDYIDAFRAVSNDPKNAALKQAYVGITIDRLAEIANAPDPDMTSLEASTEVDTRARAYMFKHPGVSYQDATRIVLDVDPGLKATYQSFQ